MPRALVGAALLLPTIAGAQTCELGETIAHCWTRLSGGEWAAAGEGNGVAAAASISDAAAESEAQEVAATNTGVDTGAAGTASTTKNFLPFLRISGLLGDGTTTDEGLIAFDINRKLPNQSLDNTQLQLIVNPSPQLYDPLKTSLADAGDTALLDDLEGELSDSDDLRLSFTYGKNGRSMGRDFLEYRQLFTALVGSALTLSDDELQANAGLRSEIERFPLYIGCIGLYVEYPPGVEEIDDLQFADIKAIYVPNQNREQFSETISRCAVANELPDPPQTGAPSAEQQEDKALRDRAIREELMRGIAYFADLDRQQAQAMEARIRQFRLDRFSDLVSNQPQVYVSIERRFVGNLVGVDQTSLSLTWEMGRANLRGFTRATDGGCTSVAMANVDVGRRCRNEFRDYVNANIATIEKADRIALSLEYADVDRYRYARPGTGLDLDVPGTTKIAFTFTYGREINRGNPDSGERIDFLLKYEDVEDDQLLNNRAIAGLTYSRKVGGSILPVTFLYSNKGEFTGDTGDQFSINFGLSFDMIGKQGQ